MKEISKISCFENIDPCRSVACKSVNLKITSYIDEVTSVFGACNFANFTDYIVPTITVRVNPVLSDLNTSETSVLYMSFDRFLLAVESRDLSQAEKSIIRVSSFPKLSDE